MSNLFNMPRVEAQDSSGGVLAGAQLTFFITGTSTKLDTYSDDTLVTANANPVIADSAGRFGAIFLRDEDYKVTLQDSADVQIWSADPVRGGVDNFADDTFRSTLDTTGSANAYALTVNRTVTAYADGDTYTAKVNFTNTGPATLNITGGQSGASALGAKSIKKHHDLALASGDQESGQWATWKYDGTNFQLQTPLATVPFPPVNVLINGDFRISQRGTTFDATTTPANSDDTVLLDRWVLLSDGNDAADISQETTTVPVGSFAAIKLDVETANKKFGILQIIEGKDAEALIGDVCSLSFQARRTGTSIANLRAAVIAWDSTVDSVTSDVVSAWEAAGTNPTLVSNWTYENTPASLAALTTSFQTFKIENISIDTSSTTNVAVFIWIDDVTTTTGDFIYITDVQLVLGPNATPFQRRLHTEELALCQRRLCKTFPQGVAPVQNVGDEIGAIHVTVQVAGTAGQCSASWDFPVTMAGTPTMTYYSPGAATADWWNVETTAQASGTASSVGAGDRGVTILNPQLANDAVQDSVAIHAQAESEL
jgi:hypothetical protein